MARKRYNNIISLAFPTDPAVPCVHPGAYERPVLTCSLARAILAFQDDSFILKVIQSDDREVDSIGRISAGEAYEKLKDVRKSGASICDEELQAGISSVAVPIADDAVRNARKCRTSGIYATSEENRFCQIY